MVDALAPIPCTALFEDGPAADAHPAAVTRTIFRSCFGTAEAAAAIDGLQRSTADMAVVQLRALGGAIARVPSDATAYAHRSQELMVNVAAMTMDPDALAPHLAWADALAAELHEPGNDGAYVNLLGTEGRDRSSVPRGGTGSGPPTPARPGTASLGSSGATTGRTCCHATRTSRRPDEELASCTPDDFRSR